VKRKSRKSSSGQRALSTMVFVGGLSFYAYKVTSDEDEEELRRIKKENEKMEKLAKEFSDMDGGVVSDDDLLASLKSRLNSTDTKKDGDGEGPDSPSMGGGDGGGSGGGGDDSPPPASDTGMSGGVGGAVLEPPSDDAAPSDPPQPAASEEDIERLKRMFGSGPE